MENVVLTTHLILALLLIGVVLLQRSEGGGLGMGGGGGAMSGRSVATALTKLTWLFAACFIATSITLTVFAAKNSVGSSVVEQFGGTPRAADAPLTAPLGTDLLPPAPSNAPATPPRADDGAAQTAPDASPATVEEPASDAAPVTDSAAPPAATAPATESTAPAASEAPAVGDAPDATEPAAATEEPPVATEPAPEARTLPEATDSGAAPADDPSPGIVPMLTYPPVLGTPEADDGAAAEPATETAPSTGIAPELTYPPALGTPRFGGSGN